MCRADGEELHCRAATTFCKCHILRPPDFPQPFFPLPPPSFLSFFIVYFWIGNELQNEQRSPWCNNNLIGLAFYSAFRGKNAWNENFLRASGICTVGWKLGDWCGEKKSKSGPKIYHEHFFVKKMFWLRNTFESELLWSCSDKALGNALWLL